MIKKYALAAIVLFAALPAVLLFQNCGVDYGAKQSFSAVRTNSVAPIGDPATNYTGTGGQIGGSLSGSGATGYTGAGLAGVVCNPFATPARPPGYGVVADGFKYFPPEQQTTIENFQDLWTRAPMSKLVNLVMSEINVPNLHFAKGFKTVDGQTLTTADGKVLSSNFGFKAWSTFVLGDWSPGRYQIATLTDDGSILKIKGAVKNANGSVSDLKISNDRYHSMKLSCTQNGTVNEPPQVMTIDNNSQFALEFDYFQGPAQSLGMIVLARPDTGQGLDPYCSKAPEGDAYYFNHHNVAGQPADEMKPYKDLLDNGWRPVNWTHYRLPPGAPTSTCAQ